MTIWFTSDLHFYHQNIIKYCNRPFNSVKEMNKHLLQYYNQTVDKNDTCYFIGDMAMLNITNLNKLSKIIQELNGRKILILGNHDDGKPFTYVNMGFESVHTSLILPEDNRFVLCHDPACSIVDDNRYWIVGHVHRMFKKLNNCINVGVDVWNYKPINLEQIKSEFDIDK